MSESEVRLLLTEEEARQAAAGEAEVSDVSPTAFISQLLELAEQQYVH